MKTISWKSPEYKHTKKTPDWYWAVGIVGGAIVIASLLFGNFLFGFLIALSFFALLLYSVRPPDMIEIEINNSGVRAGRDLFPYQNIEGFWIEERTQEKKLLLKSKKIFMPLIAVPLYPEADLAEIRDALREKIAEEPLEESVFEHIMDRIGF